MTVIHSLTNRFHVEVHRIRSFSRSMDDQWRISSHLKYLRDSIEKLEVYLEGPDYLNVILEFLSVNVEYPILFLVILVAMSRDRHRMRITRNE